MHCFRRCLPQCAKKTVNQMNQSHTNKMAKEKSNKGLIYRYLFCIKFPNVVLLF